MIIDLHESWVRQMAMSASLFGGEEHYVGHSSLLIRETPRASNTDSSRPFSSQRLPALPQMRNRWKESQGDMPGWCLLPLKRL